MNVERVSTLTLTLDQSEALDLLGFLYRALRTLDRHQSPCVLPSTNCAVGEEAIDALTGALGMQLRDVDAAFPAHELERALWRENRATPPPAGLVCLHCAKPVRWQKGAPVGSGGEWVHAGTEPRDSSHYAVAVPALRGADCGRGCDWPGRCAAYGAPGCAMKAEEA